MKGNSGASGSNRSPYPRAAKWKIGRIKARPCGSVCIRDENLELRKTKILHLRFEARKQVHHKTQDIRYGG